MSKNIDEEKSRGRKTTERAGKSDETCDIPSLEDKQPNLYPVADELKPRMATVHPCFCTAVLAHHICIDNITSKWRAEEEGSALCLFDIEAWLACGSTTVPPGYR